MKKILVLTLLMLTAIFTGCGDESATQGNGNLKVMLGSNVVSLDTAQAVDVASFEVIADCIEGLMQLDSHDKAIPALASSFEVSSDGKTYTFHLRDAKWANGADVTAEDFVFEFARCRE